MKRFSDPSKVIVFLLALALPVGLVAQQSHHYKLINLGSLGGPGGGIVGPSTGPLNNPPAHHFGQFG